MGWHHCPDGNTATPFCLYLLALKRPLKKMTDNQIPSDEREMLYSKSSTQTHSMSALDNPQPDLFPSDQTRRNKI